MSETSAKVSKIRKWSPIWIVPIITALIGIFLIFSHIANRGHQITIITHNADWINAGKTTIKSRNVNVGIVESVELSPEYDHVILNCVVDKNMGSLLKEDSVFWVVSPQIDKTGISGLGTILSGAYIELKPGTGEPAEHKPTYHLLNSPPALSIDTPGITIILNSSQTSILSIGTPVYFKGYTVGRIESADFNLLKQNMRYRVFIESPYDSLVTSNVRFWESSSIDLTISATGMELNLPTLASIIEGGITFGLPEGVPAGTPAKKYDEYELFDNYKSIHDFRYSKYREYIMFFDSSINGLESGAPVEFRGIRIGTVTHSPYVPENLAGLDELVYQIPVLIRIEPERIINDPDYDLDEIDKFLTNQPVKASLKLTNLLTGLLFVDLDIYPQTSSVKNLRKVYGYSSIPTIPGEFQRLQTTLFETIEQMGPAFAEMEQGLKEIRIFFEALNEGTAPKELKKLNSELQLTLVELQKMVRSFQSGSEIHTEALNDLRQLDKVLKELQPILKTLNEKSNSLVFEADHAKDIEPKAGGGK